MGNSDINKLIEIVHELTETFAILQHVLSSIDNKLDDVPKEKFLLERLDNIQLKLIQNIKDLITEGNSQESIKQLQSFVLDQFSKFKVEIEKIVKEDITIQQKEKELKLQVQMNQDNNEVKKEISKSNNKTKLYIAIGTGSMGIGAIIYKLIESIFK